MFLPVQLNVVLSRARIETEQSAEHGVNWGLLADHLSLDRPECTWIQGPIWAVGTSSRWLTPLLTTQTGSAPSSSASSMYSYRPSPEGALSFQLCTPTLHLSFNNPRNLST